MINEVGIDTNLFLALNGDLGSTMDSIMWIASSKLAIVPLALYALYRIYRKFGLKQLLVMLLAIGVVILIADQTCQLFKHYTPRLRPSRQPLLEGMVHTVNGYIGGKHGTVSAHAANSFGVLIFCSLMIKEWWFSIVSLLLCLTICYSRIYLGVHFPLDILYGTILGVVTALALYMACKASGMYKIKHKYADLSN